MKIIQHIALNCTNLKTMEHFYAKHFGFKRSRVFNEHTPDEFIMLRLGSTCIELFKAKTTSKDQSGGEQNIGFKHLAFEVPDIKAAVAALHADGIKTDNIADCSSIVKGLSVCFFKDPDGNQLELMQGYKDQFPQ